MKIQRENSLVHVTVVTDPIWDDFALSRTVLDSLVPGDRTLVLDLSYIVILHSPGLANLVAIHIHCQRRGIALILKQVNEHNLSVLKSTLLDRLFTIEP